MSVLLETSSGDIVIDLVPDISPNACMNFLKLCTIKYYNDCEFFRVEKGFIAQTGDPSNEGLGGKAVFAKCSPPGPAYLNLERSPYASHSHKGTVSMASSLVEGSKKLGSQFFITLTDELSYLDNEHTIIGHVAEGIDAIDKIANAFVDKNFRPYRLIRVRHTIVLHDPFEDPKGLPSDCRSPEPAQGGRGDRLGSDDEDDFDEGKDEEARMRLKEQEEEREATSRAEVLEIIGDIGNADMKPPENVLFICKLNPVTEAEDLEIIFSRFGECQAEILRDKKTGESLCYGFIEFEKKEQCEKAYFKMDSALIDDRRVRVDFSQSVSKLWNQARRAKDSCTPKVNQASGTLKQSTLRENDSSTLCPGTHKRISKTNATQGPRAHNQWQSRWTKGSTSEAVRPRKKSRFDIRPG